MNNKSPLNPDELMHLALHATNHDSPDKAISHLRELLTLQPGNGKAYYLLGALHAEIGMYDEAVLEMAKGLELDPDLPATAVFQLGLLHITAGRVDDARSVWQDLDKFGEGDALYQFKTGMLLLVEDQFEASAAALRAGLELNQPNTDLNNDMNKVLQDVENMGNIPSAMVSGGADAVSQAGQGRSMLLSVYKTNEDDNA